MPRDVLQKLVEVGERKKGRASRLACPQHTIYILVSTLDNQLELQFGDKVVSREVQQMRESDKSQKLYRWTSGRCDDSCILGKFEYSLDLIEEYFAERKLRDDIYTSREYQWDVFVRRVRLVGLTVLPTAFVTFVITVVGGVALRAGGDAYAFLNPLKRLVLNSELVAAQVMQV